jgi:hypothetical protein
MSSKIEFTREFGERVNRALSQIGLQDHLCDYASVDAVKKELLSILAAPVVERQPAGWDAEISGYTTMFVRKADRLESVRAHYEALGHTVTVNALYTTPPELAELQATIAQLESKLNRAINLDFERRAEIERLKGGQGEPAFQGRVQPWMLACFGTEISADRQERNHRFLEEALELVQACGATESEAHQLVDYVYGREIGDPVQEVGGVMVTLAALCLAHGMDMHAAGETELARIWTKVEQIRAKQKAKPAMSPLPGSYPDRTSQPAPVSVPEGWKLVPEVATLEMKNAGWQECERQGVDPEVIEMQTVWTALHLNAPICLDKVKEMNQ